MWMFEIISSLLTFIVLSSPTMVYIWRRPKGAHLPAFWKAFFLWLVSTSPVIAGILLSSPVQNDQTIQEQFASTVLARFTLSEMFVYAAAFLAPVLYVVFDIIRAINDGSIKLNKRDLDGHLRGMQGVFLSAMGILVLTLLAYASEKTDPSGFSETYLARFFTGKGYILYASSLLIWYSVILWETAPKTDFENEEKQDAADFSSEYAQRRSQET